jgi:hypothetical protein
MQSVSICRAKLGKAFEVAEPGSPKIKARQSHRSFFMQKRSVWPAAPDHPGAPARTRVSRRRPNPARKSNFAKTLFGNEAVTNNVLGKSGSDRAATRVERVVPTR